jgi:hypothetical protein
MCHWIEREARNRISSSDFRCDGGGAITSIIVAPERKDIGGIGIKQLQEFYLLPDYFGFGREEGFLDTIHVFGLEGR